MLSNESAFILAAWTFGEKCGQFRHPYTDLHPAQSVWGNNTLTPPLLFYLLSLATKRVLLPRPHPGRALLGQLAAEQRQQLGLLEGQETFCHPRACFSNILEK